MTFIQSLEQHKIRDRLFDIAWILFLIAVLLDLTAWAALDQSGTFYMLMKYMKYASAVLSIIAIVLNFTLKKYNLKWFLIYACLAIVFALTYYFSRNGILIYYFLIFAAAMKQDSKRIMTLSAIVTGAMILVNVLCGYLGLEVNYLFDSSDRMRWGLGFSWTTTGAILFFFFVLEYIYLRKQKMRWFEFAILEAVNAYFFIMTDSKMAFGLLTVILVFFFIESLFKNHWKILGRLKWLMILLPLIFAVVAIVSYLLYNPDVDFWKSLNKLFSGRYKLGASGIETYGITAFGQEINWTGYWLGNLDGAGYNYVDCSYLQLLLQNGVVTLIAVVAMYVFGAFRAFKIKDFTLLCILGFICLFSITEPRLLNLAFNAFPILVFASLNNEPLEFKKGWFKKTFTFSLEEKIDFTKKELRDEDTGEFRTSSVKKNFILNTILSLSSTLFSLITFIYVSRVLHPDGTGAVSFAFSVIGYFMIISQLGIPTYGIRACAKVRDDKEKLTKTAHEIFFLNLITTACAYVFFAIAMCVVPSMQDDKTLFIIVSMSMILSAIGVEWLYVALEQFKFITIRGVVFKLLSVIAMFLLVRAESDYVIYGAISVFAGSAMSILNFAHARKFVSFKWQRNYNLKRHLRPVFVFFAMACATTIYTNLDIGMLGFMKGTTDTGYYNAAVRIKTIIVGIVNALGNVLLPRASYYIEKGMEEEFKYLGRKALNFTFVASVPVVAYFMLFADEGIYLLSGELYGGSIAPMQIIMPTVLFIGITTILGFQILTPMGKEKSVLHSVCVGAAVDLILNLILIPEMGAEGAAIGTLAAEFAVLVYQFIVLRKSRKLLFGDIKYFKIIVATIAALVVSWWVKLLPLSYFLTLLISAILFFAMYYVMLRILKEPFVKDVSIQMKSFLVKKIKKN